MFSSALLSKAREGFEGNLRKSVLQSVNNNSIPFKSGQQIGGQKYSSSHHLVKPGDLKVTTSHAETSPSELQREWCTVPSESHYDGQRQCLLCRPCDFTSLLGPEAYVLSTSTSDEDWCSASSYIMEASVPQMGLLKPCDFKLSKSIGYSSMNSSLEGGKFTTASRAITPTSLHRVCLLRPCDMGLSKHKNPSSSETSQEQDRFSVSSHTNETRPYQICLLRPGDICSSISKNSPSPSELDVEQDWFSTSSQPKVSSLHLLRPFDITTPGSQNVSSTQKNSPLPWKLHLVRPCDLTKSSSTSHEVTFSSNKSDTSPLTPTYLSASSHLPDSFHETFYSSASLGHDDWSVTKEGSPLPMRYLHRTASYSCRSSG